MIKSRCFPGIVAILLMVSSVIIIAGCIDSTGTEYNENESGSETYFPAAEESNETSIEVVAAKQPDLIQLSLYDDALITFSTSVEYINPEEKGPRNIELKGLLASMATDDLSIRSDVILIGTVKEIQPGKWNIPGGWDNTSVRGRDKTMYTDIVINVDQYLKNPQSSDEIIVRVRGGNVEDTIMSADFEPDFTQNETVLLFLKDDPFQLTRDLPPEHFAVTGYIQGKFVLTEEGNVIGWRKTLPLDELLTTIETHVNTTMELPEDFIGHMIIDINAEMEKLSYNDLNRRSEVILIGTVQEIHAAKWNTPDGKIPVDSFDDLQSEDTIYTDINISVDQYLKNPQPSDELIVRIEGGAVDDVIIITDYEPDFTEDEKVLLYLNKGPFRLTETIGPEHFVVTGNMQGKFTLTDDGKAVGYGEKISLQELLDMIDG